MHPRKTEQRAGLCAHRLEALKISGGFPLLMICFAYMAAFYGVYGFVGDHLVASLKYPVRATALIAASYSAGFGIATFADALIDRLGSRRLMPACFLFNGLVYGLIVLLAVTACLLCVSAAICAVYLGRRP